MMQPPRKKRIVAAACDTLQINRLGLIWQKLFYRPFIRSVNYHSVPASCADNFERQLQYYQQYFVSAGYDDLIGLADGQWPYSKPGLIISFDDGCRDNAEVAAPLLEKYGFTGWFFVPTDFVDTPDDEQPEYAAAHQIFNAMSDEPSSGHALTWNQVSELADRHVVGCHTESHCRLQAELGAERLNREIAGAKNYLEQKLGREIPIFCWVGGEEWSYSREAARQIKNAGYRVSFMTNSAIIRPGTNLLQLQRSNVEAGWDLPVVRFQLSGIMDLLYTAKRRRVNELTS